MKYNNMNLILKILKKFKRMLEAIESQKKSKIKRD